MPTPSEQKALAFVAIVILLGGAVRVLRAGGAASPTSLEQQALARQATSADSAASAARTAKQSKRSRAAKSPRKRDTLPVIVGGVESVPSSFARPDQPFARTPYGTPSARLGFPPPDSRIDTYPHGVTQPPTGRSSVSESGNTSRAKKSLAGPPLDLDTASESSIERLPRVGPTLARRMVANRDSMGPFRSLEGLRRVKGIGQTTVQSLAPFVTFSGATAPRRGQPRY